MSKHEQADLTIDHKDPGAQFAKLYLEISEADRRKLDKEGKKDWTNKVSLMHTIVVKPEYETKIAQSFAMLPEETPDFIKSVRDEVQKLFKSIRAA